MHISLNNWVFKLGGGGLGDGFHSHLLNFATLFFSIYISVRKTKQNKTKTPTHACVQSWKLDESDRFLFF